MTDALLDDLCILRKLAHRLGLPDDTFRPSQPTDSEYVLGGVLKTALDLLNAWETERAAGRWDDPISREERYALERFVQQRGRRVLSSRLSP
jgi:hypothetical protein